MFFEQIHSPDVVTSAGDGHVRKRGGYGRMRIVYLPLILAVALVFTGCEDDSSSNSETVTEQQQNQTPDDESEGTISFNGTVSYKEFEGGFFAIDADDGHNYDPTDLPEQFAVNGLRVAVTGRIRDDLASVHGYGPIIDIVSITTL